LGVTAGPPRCLQVNLRITPSPMSSSAPSAFLVAILIFASLLLGSHAKSFLRSGIVSEKDATEVLEAELAGGVHTERLAKLEDRLRLTYKSLPKNAAGNLGHQAVRYVLHRFFVQEHGWFIRGLEPNNNTWTSDAKPTSVKEWVPGYLQGLLEKRLGERGTSLHELAALAAALEDLVRREAVGRLQTAYSIHGLPTREAVPEEEVEAVVATYFVMYLLAGNFSASGLQELDRKKLIFSKKYTGWAEAKDWLAKILDPALSPGRKGVMDFDGVTGLVSSIGEQYYTFNDLECKSLKSTLRELEGKKAGRVRLSQFYKTGLHSHWRFNEKAEYLRSLGALDESDPDTPRVIVPNYVMARTNCLEASKLYAICCRNECEDLMGHIEQQVGAEAAYPDQIVSLAAALPSDTVSAPRNLSSVLVKRLREVASRNGGKVPLHGRLFAQWMHHAYPHECPYPHEVGKTNPQTPDEWMKVTGNSESMASTQEMIHQVESDTCASDAPHAGSGCGEEEDSELPWNEAEELLLVQHPKEAAADGGEKPPARSLRSDLGPAFAVAIFLVGFMVVEYQRALQRPSGKDKETQANGWLAVPLGLVMLCAYLLGILDGAAVACAFGLGLAGISLRQRAAKGPSGKSKLPL